MMSARPDLVSARAATSSDVAGTVALANQVSVATRPDRGGRWLLDHDTAFGPPADEAHAAAITDARRHLVVGCVDEVPVGYGLATLSSTTDGQLCMIDELVVHPAARAVGVGSAILAEVRLWAVANECQAIESQVLPGNRAAKNFFERVGMKTRKMRVSADL